MIEIDTSWKAISQYSEETKGLVLKELNILYSNAQKENRLWLSKPVISYEGNFIKYQSYVEKFL